MAYKMLSQKPDEVSQKGGSRMEIAKVSQVDYEKGLVRLLLESKEDSVTNWIPYLSFEYEMPNIGDVVLFIPENTNYTNAYSFGLCFGRYYNDIEVPKMSGKDIYYKPMLGDIIFIYNSTEKKLTIQTDKLISVKSVDEISIKANKITLEAKEIKLEASKIQLLGNTEINGTLAVNGEVTLNGNTKIDGNLAVTGVISASNV